MSNRRPSEKTSWTCTLATVGPSGVRCPATGRCRDCIATPNEETRTIATVNACADAMSLIGKQREEMLAQIAASLNVMLGSAVALVDGMGNVVGYQIKTGALHRVLGYMAGLDHPVTVPLCRTQLVLNHESSPWPLEGAPHG